MDTNRSLAAKRVYRLSFTTALALAGGYGLQLPLPFLAPIFAFILTAKPSPPMGFKGLLGLILLVIVTLGMGIMLVPVLKHYPFSGLPMVAVGLYFSNYLSVGLGKGAVASLLAVGLTMISAVGTLSFALASSIIQALALGIGLAALCQRIVYPFFPESGASPAATKTKAPSSYQAHWIALRATLIVLPAYFLLLTNPLLYMPIIMKAVSLGQQGSMVSARNAGRELLGSTFLAGCFSILFWFALDLVTNLWMFFLWMLLFAIYFSGKLYQALPSRFPASFWTNVVVTMLILLGPAVEDSATGKDVYKAFAVRMALFVAVTVYAWIALQALEYLKSRRQRKLTTRLAATQPSLC